MKLNSHEKKILLKYWYQQCVTVHHVPKCMSCHKVIVVITGRAHCFHDCIYIMLTYITYSMIAYIYIYIYMYVYIYIHTCIYIYIHKHNLCNYIIPLCVYLFIFLSTYKVLINKVNCLFFLPVSSWQGAVDHQNKETHLKTYRVSL